MNLGIKGNFKNIIEDGPVAGVKKYDWAGTIGDSLILAGITFFTALGGTAIIGVTGLEAIVAGLVAAGAQFCTVLALKRGLVREEI